MKILLLTSSVYGDPTLVSIMEGVAKAYRQAGHVPTLAGIRHLGNADTGVIVKPWGKIVLLGRGTSSWLDAARVFAQFWTLLPQVDAVHFFLLGLWTPTLTAAWLACRLRSAPRGVSFLGWLKPQGKLYRWRRFLEGSRWVTALSGSIGKDIETVLPALAGKIRTVSGGFDPEERDAAGGPPRSGAYVLSVARLAPYKGTDVLLMAWKDVCERVQGVDLVLCGPDRYDGLYRKLAESLGVASRVVFTDLVDRAGVWSLLRSCTAVVLASRREAFGVAVVEGQAAGKPVLATRSGGPEEIIEDGETGLLVAPRDVDALRDGLLKLLGDAELRRDLGARARAAAERYRWTANVQDYLSLWNAQPDPRPTPHEHTAALLERA